VTISISSKLILPFRSKTNDWRLDLSVGSCVEIAATVDDINSLRFVKMKIKAIDFASNTVECVAEDDGNTDNLTSNKKYGSASNSSYHDNFESSVATDMDIDEFNKNSGVFSSDSVISSTTFDLYSEHVCKLYTHLKAPVSARHTSSRSSYGQSSYLSERSSYSSSYYDRPHTNGRPCGAVGTVGLSNLGNTWYDCTTLVIFNSYLDSIQLCMYKKYAINSHFCMIGVNIFYRFE